MKGRRAADQRAVLGALKEFERANYRAALKQCEDRYTCDGSNVDNLLLLGAIHFQLRNLSESIFYSQQCLRVEPDCAEAHCIIGNCFKELRDLESAHNFFTKAVRLNPRLSDSYCNLASVQSEMRRPLEAIESLEIAISLNPAQSDAFSNLGNVLMASGRPDDAKKRYLDAIRVNPQCSVAWSGLGGLFHDCGEHDKAIESCREAIKVAPNFADAYSNLGNSLRECGKSTKDTDLIQEAKAAYRTALDLRRDFALARSHLALCHLDEGDNDLAIQQLRISLLRSPNCVDALSNLAGMYVKCGSIDSAVKLCMRALRIKPDHTHAYNNLGVALYRKGLLREGLHCFAMASQLSKHSVIQNNIGVLLSVQGKASISAKYLRQAVGSDPHFSEAYMNLGNVYLDNGKLEHAESCYRVVLDTAPDDAGALTNLALLKQASGNFDDAYAYSKKAVELSPESDEVFVTHVFLAACCCDWSNRATDISRLRLIAERAVVKGDLMCPVQPFFATSCTLLQDVGLSLQLSQLYAQRAIARSQCHRSTPFDHEPPNGYLRRMKLGYVSSSFGRAIKSVFGLHCEKEFDILCYSLAPDEDNGHQPGHKDISRLSDGAAAEEINRDGVDILIDLNGYTAGARPAIFALKPAPVQVVLSNHHVTMGANYYDYIVADDTIIPQEHRSGFTEKVIHVPNVMNSCRALAPFVLDDDFDEFEIRSKFGILDDVFVYASFALPYQIHPTVFNAWLNILEQVDDSILVLVRFNASFEAALTKEAVERGVEAKRLVFLDYAQEDEERIRRCCIVDLFLDAESGCESLWTGTPMISIVGDSMCNRIGVSLLKTTGLDELAVKDLEQYQQLAVLLNTDEDKYMGIIRKLEDARSESGLFDTKKWVELYEKGLKEAWRRRC